MSLQNREHRPKGMMWFGGQYVPILSSSSRKDMPGTEAWVARGNVQRIGVSFLAMFLLCFSVALVVSTPFLAAEILREVDGFMGRMLGTVLVALVLAGASLVMFMSFRMFRGVARSYRKRTEAPHLTSPKTPSR
jgi:hypothetical protein